MIHMPLILIEEYKLLKKTSVLNDTLNRIISEEVFI